MKKGDIVNKGKPNSSLHIGVSLVIVAGLFVSVALHAQDNRPATHRIIKSTSTSSSVQCIAPDDEGANGNCDQWINGAHGRLVQIQTLNDATGTHTEFFDSSQTSRSPDRRYVATMLINSYAKPTKWDAGILVSSIATKAIYDCSKRLVSYRGEFVYANTMATGEIIQKNDATKKIWIRPYQGSPTEVQFDTLCAYSGDPRSQFRGGAGNQASQHVEDHYGRESGMRLVVPAGVPPLPATASESRSAVSSVECGVPDDAGHPFSLWMSRNDCDEWIKDAIKLSEARTRKAHDARNQYNDGNATSGDTMVHGAPDHPTDFAIASDAVMLDEYRSPDGIRVIGSAVRLVRAYGYVCDSVDTFGPMLLERGQQIKCDNWTHKYKIKDIGGRVTVIAE